MKFDSAGNFLARFDVAVEDRGSDWIELAADQRTLFYTSEGDSIKRFDVVSNTQLPDFVTNALPGFEAFALRLLPGGGLLVSDDDDVKRRGLGQALPEAAAQIDDRHDDAAQVEHAAHVVGLLREMRDLRPALDLAHRHDVDAVLVFTDGKADELGHLRASRVHHRRAVVEAALGRRGRRGHGRHP